MAQPERNPFEPPASDVGFERAAAEPFRWRRRMLVGVLSVQLIASVLLLAALAIDDRPGTILVVLVFQVVPSGAAIWALLRKNPAALMVSLISGLLLIGLMVASTAPGKRYVQILGFIIFGLTFSLMWSQGMLKRKRSG